jgi:acetyl esterase/lipase
MVDLGKNFLLGRYRVIRCACLSNVLGEGNSIKSSFLAIALLFFVFTVSFISAFPNDSIAKSQITSASLLPEITNCTVTRGIRYELDNSTYHLMDVYLPVGDGFFPAMVYIHGGGWTRGNRSNYNDIATYYAKRGIAGFAIDYTLSTLNDFAWPQNIQDVFMAIRFIKENAQIYGIDPSRIVLLGFSSGGHLASLVGTLSGNESFLVGSSGDQNVSGSVCLVIDYCGPTDLQFIGQYERNTFIYNITRNAFGSTYDADPNLWIEASPATYISHDDPVFFIAHGTNDTIVPIDISDSFNAKLHDAGVETHYLRLIAADHTALTASTKILVIRNALEPLLQQVLFYPHQSITSDFPTLFIISLAAAPIVLISVLVIYSLKYKKKAHALSS